MEQLLQVGVITQPHGVRGEVKVFPTTDDPVRFKKLKKVILDTGKEKLDLEVEHVKFFKQFAILKFKGIDNINDIEKYRGKSLMIDREDAVDDEMAVVGFAQHHVSAPQIAFAQGAKRDAAAASEEGQHTLAQYADDDFASREQLVAGFRKEHTVGNGAFHRSAIVVSNESRAASASGRHSNW